MAKPEWVYIVAAVRRIWRWSAKRRDVLKTAKCCYVCHKKFKEYQADHVVPVGTAPRDWNGWDGYFKRMFLGELKAICKACHKLKTAQERRQRNAERKRGVNKL